MSENSTTPVSPTRKTHARFGPWRRARQPAAATAGFTLVELSIALIIIGLLVGAVLQGREMLGRARLDATVGQIEAIRAAVDSFRQSYGTLPGDDPQALSHFGAGINNGNGDGTINGNGANDESLAAWRHLSRAGLLANIDAVATGGLAQTPPTPIGGVYEILSETVQGSTRHWLRLGNQTGGAGSVNTNGLLTPLQAEKIDSRLDDGQPTRGRVRARGANCISGSAYDVGADDTCTLAISLF